MIQFLKKKNICKIRVVVAQVTFWEKMNLICIHNNYIICAYLHAEDFFFRDLESVVKEDFFSSETPQT